VITLSLPCAIKGCLRYVRVQLKDDALKPDEFVICQPCGSAVSIQMLAELNASGIMDQETVLEFARLVNDWYRKRKGVALPVRPVGTATYKPVKEVDFDKMDFDARQMFKHLKDGN
jgi:hypothetical protein